jgi:hypothetical protein
MEKLTQSNGIWTHFFSFCNKIRGDAKFKGPLSIKPIFYLK